MTPAELRERREALGLGPAELARRLGVSYLAVWRWESGSRAIPPLLPLALETVERRLADELALGRR